MRHRHLSSTDWSRAAIDSALEYGGLEDWRELFLRIRQDRALGAEVLAVCRDHPMEGASVLGRLLVLAVWPGLDAAAAA